MTSERAQRRVRDTVAALHRSACGDTEQRADKHATCEPGTYRAQTGARGDGGQQASEGNLFIETEPLGDISDNHVDALTYAILATRNAARSLGLKSDLYAGVPGDGKLDFLRRRIRLADQLPDRQAPLTERDAKEIIGRV